jgi:hypothetical protein
MDADAHREFGPACELRRPGQALHAGGDVQAGAHGTLGIVVVRGRETEVRQDAVTGVLVQGAAVAFDALAAYLLVGAQQCPQGLGVQLRRKRRGADDVRKKHGELPPFAIARWRECFDVGLGLP